MLIYFLPFEVLKPLFLLGNWAGNSELRQRLEEENNIHGDILQSSIIDGYNKLSYKTVTGLVWTNWYVVCQVKLSLLRYTNPASTKNLIFIIYSFCSETNFILKIDDDVHMNYEYLVEVLSEKYNQSNLPENVVECPSPLRNKKPFRPRVSGSNTVLGKWSVTFIVTLTSYFFMKIIVSHNTNVQFFAGLLKQQKWTEGYIPHFAPDGLT